MIKNRAGGIVIQDNKVLLIHRIKNSKEFWVIPGGTIEDGETAEEAIIREMLEETSAQVKIIEKVLEFKSPFNQDATETYFSLETLTTKVELNKEGPEAIRMAESNNTNFYELVWIPITSVKDYLIYPQQVKDYLLQLNSQS